jgi:adhesin transport system outer membrane protein
MAREQIEILSGSNAPEVVEFDPDLIQMQANALPLLAQDIRSTHPSLKRLTTQIQISKAERDRAKAVLAPNISLRGEYSNGSLYSDNQPSDTIMYISAQMSPGAGFSSLSNIQSAEAKILQAQFDQQSKERELTDAGVRDYSSYKTAQERINSMDETIRSAQAVFDSYTRLFIAGKRQWLDLVNSSRELTLNKVSLADLKATYAVSAYQLALKWGQIPLSGANP